MKNPGLKSFAAPTTFAERSLLHDFAPDDPDYDPEFDEDPSDFTPGKDFGRWKNPGYSIRVPTKVGPAFKPEEMPSDVIQGEISPAEKDATERVYNGEHDSDYASANPDVDRARRDLKTPGADLAVQTLGKLVDGGTPHPDEMSAAHSYLSGHFTGLSVNTHHGVLTAYSPYGKQLVRRQVNLPAVRDQEPEVSYHLETPHGDELKFHERDRAVKTLIALQMLRNEAGKRQEDKEKKKDIGLALTSGVKDWFKPRTVGPHPLDVPDDAIFEPGRGTDYGFHGGRLQQGGYVMPRANAPEHWDHDDEVGVSYSPGSHESLVHNKKRATTPIEDPDVPGHYFTYKPHGEYTYPIGEGDTTYYVHKLHPLAIAAEKKRMRAGEPEPSTVPRPAIPSPAAVMPAAPTVHPLDWNDEDPIERRHGAVMANDLCPVCVSGYLEPYDGEHHECLNCGSLVKHIGFEKSAAPKRRPMGLGKGLSQLLDEPQTGDPLNLAAGGSEAEDFVTPEAGHHPLHGQENQTPEEERYRARKRLLDKEGSEFEPVTMDEHLGKFGYRPIHEEGASLRSYLAELPGARGGYTRLTELPNDAWRLTADKYHPRDQWSGQRDSLGTQDAGSWHPHGERMIPFPEQGDKMMPDTSLLAEGHHPVHDPELAKAIADVSVNGRDSETYQRVLANPFVPEKLPVNGPDQSPQTMRRLNSQLDNPGLAMFVS